MFALKDFNYIDGSMFILFCLKNLCHGFKVVGVMSGTQL
jgi:hypothetical protein